MLVVHHEPENHAPRATAEAMKGLPLRVHMKGRALLLDERGTAPGSSCPRASAGNTSRLLTR